ncbi:MAG: hypothetical protein ACYDCC_11145 [Actinomycetota bacterium]
MSVEVVAVRIEQYNSSHDHVVLVGYHSNHIASEPIMLSTERTLQRMSLGETFVITQGDQTIELIEGSCPVCGYAPYLRTKADSGDDQKLMELPAG